MDLTARLHQMQLHNRLDHVGLTVPDIDAATTLFGQLLGARHLYDVGPFQADGDWMTENVGVHPRAVIRTLRMLALPGGGMLELFAYEGPESGSNVPLNSQVGGYHVAFRVADINAMVQRARELGLRVLGDVKCIDAGPSAGLSWVYVVAPWGSQLEFVSYADDWPPGAAQT
jgi:catechol 2,3-dioxygenase-like lactoylglutathione lyase family enzyme